jgi:hypothetical protein
LKIRLADAASLVSVFAFFVHPTFLLVKLVPVGKLKITTVVLIISMLCLSLIGFSLTAHPVKSVLVDVLIFLIFLVVVIEFREPVRHIHVKNTPPLLAFVLKITCFVLAAFCAFKCMGYVMKSINSGGSINDFRYFNGSIFIYWVLFTFYLLVVFSRLRILIAPLSFMTAFLLVEEHGLALVVLLWPFFYFLSSKPVIYLWVFIILNFLTYAIALNFTEIVFGLRAREVIDVMNSISIDLSLFIGKFLGFRLPMSEPINLRGEVIVNTYGFFHLSILAVFAKTGLFGVVLYTFLLAKFYSGVLRWAGRWYGGLTVALLFALEIYAGGMMSKYFTSTIIFLSILLFISSSKIIYRSRTGV